MPSGDLDVTSPPLLSLTHGADLETEHLTPLVKMSPVQHSSLPPARFPQPGPPQAPHEACAVEDKDTFGASEQIIKD